MNIVANYGWRLLCTLCPRLAVHIQYRHIMGHNLDLSIPVDLNEKINYLKFHANLNEWARLADKFAVREYVKEKGLEDILVPLIGKYDSVDELMSDWNNLPDRFVVKTNHGCGTVKIVKNRGKTELVPLKREVDKWLKMRFGIDTNEPHYKRIKPCIIVEKLLEDLSVAEYSCSMIDYKVWCFNGKPYCVLVVSNRDTVTGDYQLDVYDVNWCRVKEALTKVHKQAHLIPKPKNFDKMLGCASILAEGHKEVRVDLYNIDGEIYFGEMTFTSQGGYMNYFTKEFLMKMGKQFEVK